MTSTPRLKQIEDKLSEMQREIRKLKALVFSTASSADTDLSSVWSAIKDLQKSNSDTTTIINQISRMSAMLTAQFASCEATLHTRFQAAQAMRVGVTPIYNYVATDAYSQSETLALTRANENNDNPPIALRSTLTFPIVDVPYSLKVKTTSRAMEVADALVVAYECGKDDHGDIISYTFTITTPTGSCNLTSNVALFGDAPAILKTPILAAYGSVTGTNQGKMRWGFIDSSTFDANTQIYSPTTLLEGESEGVFLTVEQPPEYSAPVAVTAVSALLSTVEVDLWAHFNTGADLLAGRHLLIAITQTADLEIAALNIIANQYRRTIEVEEQELTHNTSQITTLMSNLQQTVNDLSAGAVRKENYTVSFPNSISAAIQGIASIGPNSSDPLTWDLDVTGSTQDNQTHYTAHCHYEDQGLLAYTGILNQVGVRMTSAQETKDITMLVDIEAVGALTSLGVTKAAPIFATLYDTIQPDIEAYPIAGPLSIDWARDSGTSDVTFYTTATFNNSNTRLQYPNAEGSLFSDMLICDRDSDVTVTLSMYFDVPDALPLTSILTPGDGTFAIGPAQAPVTWASVVNTAEDGTTTLRVKAVTELVSTLSPGHVVSVIPTANMLLDRQLTTIKYKEYSSSSGRDEWTKSMYATPSYPHVTFESKLVNDSTKGDFYYTWHWDEILTDRDTNWSQALIHVKEYCAGTDATALVLLGGTSSKPSALYWWDKTNLSPLTFTQSGDIFTLSFLADPLHASPVQSLDEQQAALESYVMFLATQIQSIQDKVADMDARIDNLEKAAQASSLNMIVNILQGVIPLLGSGLLATVATVTVAIIQESMTIGDMLKNGVSVADILDSVVVAFGAVQALYRYDKLNKLTSKSDIHTAVAKGKVVQAEAINYHTTVGGAEGTSGVASPTIHHEYVNLSCLNDTVINKYLNSVMDKVETHSESAVEGMIAKTLKKSKLLPYHERSVITTFEEAEDGSAIKRVLVTGVGDGAAGDPFPKSTGGQLKSTPGYLEFVYKADKEAGEWKLLPYGDAGVSKEHLVAASGAENLALQNLDAFFTEEEFQAMYERLNQKYVDHIAEEPLPTPEPNHYAVYRTNKMNVNLVSGQLAGLKAMLDSEATNFNYSLFGNNCQNYCSGMQLLLTTGKQPSFVSDAAYQRYMERLRDALA